MDEARQSEALRGIARLLREKARDIESHPPPSHDSLFRDPGTLEISSLIRQAHERGAFSHPKRVEFHQRLPDWLYHQPDDMHSGISRWLAFEKMSEWLRSRAERLQIDEHLPDGPCQEVRYVCQQVATLVERAADDIVEVDDTTSIPRATDTATATPNNNLDAQAAAYKENHSEKSHQEVADHSHVHYKSVFRWPTYMSVCEEGKSSRTPRRGTKKDWIVEAEDG